MKKMSGLIVLLVAVAGTAIATDSQARQHSRSVQRTAQGGQVAVGRSNASFQSQRNRQWQNDGQGNVSGSRSGSLVGANGGNAGYQGSAYRNADGSAGRQGSATINGRYGGTATTAGNITRDADGNVSGSRATDVTGRNGNSYTGSTTVENGSVIHTGTCTNAAGEVISCRR